jgi:AcrR family transcriptional regulator
MSLAKSHERTGRRRGYHSPLRERQAADTHDRILEALARTMAKGVSELSVPAVAHEAGVSVATVYRHFPNKEALLGAVPEYFARRSGMDQRWTVPANWLEYEGLVGRLFAAYARFDEVARAAVVSQLAQRAKRSQLPGRVEFARDALAGVAPGLSGAALDRVARLSLVLVTSSTFQMYRSIGLTTKAATDHVLWAIRTAIEAEGVEVVER